MKAQPQTFRRRVSSGLLGVTMTTALIAGIGAPAMAAAPIPIWTPAIQQEFYWNHIGTVDAGTAPLSETLPSSGDLDYSQAHFAGMTPDSYAGVRMGFDNDTEYSLAVRPVEAVVGGDIAPYINAYFDASWADAEGLAKDRVLAAGEGVPATTQVVGMPYTVGNEARGLEGTFGWSWQIYAVPITVDDSGYTTTSAQPITITDWKANDTLAPAELLDTISFSLGESDPAAGTWELDDTGAITFTPADGFVGIASVAYTASGIGGYSSTSTISVDVQADPVGEPPVARDDRAETVSGTPVTVAVLDNDSEIDAEAEVTIIESDDAQGDWVVEPSRSVTFTPASAFVGAAEATYRVENPDGQFSTAIITIDVAAPGIPVPDPGDPVDPAPVPPGAPAEPAPPVQPSPAPEGRPAASGTPAGAGVAHTQLARTGAADPSAGAMFGGGLLLLGAIGVAAAARLRVRR